MNSNDFYTNNKENITYDGKYLYNNEGDTIANANIPIEMRVYECKSVDGTYETYEEHENDSNNRKIYLGSNRFSTGDYIKTSDSNEMILNCNLDTDTTPSTMCFKYNKITQEYQLSGNIIEPMNNGKVTDTDTTDYSGNYFLFARCGTINTISSNVIKCTFKIKENSKLSKPQISYETTVNDDLQTIVIFTIAVPSIAES